MPTRTDLDHHVVIIGAGFAGIGMAVGLQQAGIDDFVVLEKDDDLGGTWRDNTYPGCACDVPSYLYSFSFEQNPYWSRMFAPQEEIWDYLRRCVDKYGIADRIRYGARWTGAAFDQASGTWQVEVDGAETLTSRALVSGVGALHMPKYPALPGLGTFAGTTFHSAQWDHDHDLTGRRVAVIGTGASAVQFVPRIAEQVERLDLYQRSAAWVTPKPDRVIPRREQRLYERSPLAQRIARTLVYWAMEVRGAGFALTPKAMKAIEWRARRHLERQVADPELRAKLTPDYQVGCKRVLLSDDYYPALTRDNVEVVTDGIAEVTPHGIVTEDGTKREVDTIIYGTGFEVSGNLTHVEVRGAGGAELNQRWSERGIGAHLGITVSGFPNLFLLLGPNTGLGHSSVVFMIEQQVNYVLQALHVLERHEADYVDVRPDTEQTFLDRVQSRLADTVWQSGCKSWYVDEDGRNFTIWPHFTWKYWLEARRFHPREYVVARADARDGSRPVPAAQAPEMNASRS